MRMKGQIIKLRVRAWVLGFAFLVISVDEEFGVPPMPDYPEDEL